MFDAVVEHLSNQDAVEMRPVHVLGLHIKDNPQAADVGAQNTVDLLGMLADAGDWENELGRVLEDFQQKANKQVLHAVMFY